MPASGEAPASAAAPYDTPSAEAATPGAPVNATTPIPRANMFRNARAVYDARYACTQLVLNPKFVHWDVYREYFYPAAGQTIKQLVELTAHEKETLTSEYLVALIETSPR